VGVALCALAVVVVGVAATREPGIGMLLWAIGALPLAAIGAGVVLWGLAYRQLTYTLAEAGLEVAWLGSTLVVPYDAIDGVYSGQRLVGHAVPMLPVWPGIYVGPGRARGIGRLRFFATSPDPATLTLITLHHGGVVVSARNPHDFRLALIDRLQAATHDESPTPTSWARRAPARAPWTAILDPWFLPALATAALLLLLCLLVLSLGYDALPGQIFMRFDGTGQATQIAPRGDLLRLPLIGLLALLANAALGAWLHPRERLLARMLWVAAALLEGLTLVAVVRLLQ